MKILLLGGKGGGSSTKGFYLRDRGHQVFEPRMPYYWRSLEAWLPSQFWFQWLRRSLRHSVQRGLEAELAFRPEVIVGDSMGGAVALGMRSQNPLLLLAPAVQLTVRGPIRSFTHGPKFVRTFGTFPGAIADVLPGWIFRFGRIAHLPATSLILHCPTDDWVPYESSREILRHHAKDGDDSLDRSVARIERWARSCGGDPEPGCGRLVATGFKHQLNDDRSRGLMLEGVSLLAEVAQEIG